MKTKEEIITEIQNKCFKGEVNIEGAIQLAYTAGFESCREKVEEEIQIRNPESANPQSKSVQYGILSLKTLLKAIKEIKQ